MIIIQFFGYMGERYKKLLEMVFCVMSFDLTQTAEWCEDLLGCLMHNKLLRSKVHVAVGVVLLLRLIHEHRSVLTVCLQDGCRVRVVCGVDHLRDTVERHVECVLLLVEFMVWVMMLRYNRPP